MHLIVGVCASNMMTIQQQYLVDNQITQMPEGMVLIMTKLINTSEGSWMSESLDPCTRMGKPIIQVASSG